MLWSTTHKFLQYAHIFMVFIFCGIVSESYGQTYATAVSFATSPANASVTNPTHAQSSNGILEPSTTPLASISATGTLTSSRFAYLELQFPSGVPSNTAVWVRVSNQTNGLNTTITAEVRNSTGTVAGSSSEFITAANGDTYYRVSATNTFDRARITADAGSGLVTGTASVRIHYAFYEIPSTICPRILGTTTSATLLSSIANPERAIDNNLTTHSTFYPLVSATLTQTVYFSALSNPNDAATITFSLPPTILNLGLFNSIRIFTYNGNTEVSNVPLSSLLRLDLLGLLSSGQKYTVSHMPSAAFDRIRIVYTVGVSLALGSSLNIYEISRTPAKPSVPTVYPSVIHICDGESATITTQPLNSTSYIRWYNAPMGGTLLQQDLGTSSTYSTPQLYHNPSANDTTFLYVATAWTGVCNSESERTKIAIVVHPKPTVAPIIGPNQVCITQPVSFSSATSAGVWSSADPSVATVTSSGLVSGVVPGNTIIRYTVTHPTTLCYTIQEKSISINEPPGISLSSAQPICEGETNAQLGYTALTGNPQEYSILWNGPAPGFTNITGATLPSSPIIITVPTSATPGLYTAVIRITNTATGCTGSDVPFTIDIHPKPGRPALTINP